MTWTASAGPGHIAVDEKGRIFVIDVDAALGYRLEKPEAASAQPQKAAASEAPPKPRRSSVSRLGRPAAAVYGSFVGPASFGSSRTTGSSTSRPGTEWTNGRAAGVSAR